MIQILGIKRVLILGMIVCVNLFLGALVYGLLMPHEEQAHKELSSLEGQISSRRQEIEGIRGEIDRFASQKDQFDELHKMGFFSSQNRILARAKFDELRELSKILTAKYKIDKASYETNDQISKAGHVILKSSVTVGIEAIDDVDIYRFLYLLDTAFPGHAAVESLKINKNQDVTQALLRQIGNGIPSALVNGELTFVWRTVLPEDQAGAVIQSDQKRGM